ncbi:glycosyltransferase [Billgrantia gudaonensis]|uniref:Glycosyltransferase involved in cell wall bisynthesis n=1 Tax=Billgrantia gudaonensis TaxID=376427 RepID=A0A1G8QYA5_9GAMM|nr:glycosyltransferase [Halomonas gudaonensis]SDJ09742.1 Glycosyltransferase involved in cell wall bisynthesis [Halomonas gudaonensis]
MKIVNLVLNNFINDSRVLKTSKTLASHGHEVQVVALHETGLPENEKDGSIRIHRISLVTRNWSKNRVVQAIKFIEFLIRFIINYRRADVLHCNDLNALIIGALCKATRPAISIVYDSHEYAINDKPNQSLCSKKFKYFLERFLIFYADQVITVSDSIAEEYARIYKITKPSLVLNCPKYREQPKCNFFREELGLRSDQTIFLYQGGLSKGRGIELILEAFTGLGSDKNVLVCMGYGPLEILIQRRAKESNTIFFYPAVAPDAILNFTSSADYGISFIEDSCLSYRYCLPNKLFEYLMSGLPVLTSNLYEMKRLVEKEGVGVVAESNTVEGFRKAVMDSLSQDYSSVQENVFEARKKYCWEEQEKIIKEIYDAL